MSVDRRLPGASERRTPRIGAGAVGAVVSCLLLVGLVAAHGAWSSHKRSIERAHRHAAEQRLAAITLPERLASTSSGSGCLSVDMLCASSAMSAEALRPVVESLLSGRSSTVVCRVLTLPADGCPVIVYGNIAGYPAVAHAFPHLIDVRNGQPPAGAVPSRQGSHRTYSLGSDVIVSLIVPTS